MHARTPRVVISVEVFSTRIKKERDHNEFRAVGSSADPTTSSFRIVFMCDGRGGCAFDPRDSSQVVKPSYGAGCIPRFCL